MEAYVVEVERILGYRFKNRKLLEEALTHSSSKEGVPYERLEFMGDSIISLAISKHLFLAYPKLDPGQLSSLRDANISTEKLARVAIRRNLHCFIRHSSPDLLDQIKQFVHAVALENHSVVVAHGGSVKAPKVLSDIVESVAGAMYFDLGCDLEKFWKNFRVILEPIVTPGDLELQPHPVKELFEICQKMGKHVEIKPVRNETESIAYVFVDGQFIASASSATKDLAKLEAAKIALERLASLVPLTSMRPSIGNVELNFYTDDNGDMIIEGAKHKLHELSQNKKWSKPEYRIEGESGPSHEKRFVCSVEITIEEEEGVFLRTCGYEKSRVKDAENSAASVMLMALLGV
ncbi:ribonuclease 3-like protein 2 [Vigna unguiculata]|uniref:Endoribonuclease Dicer n=1 Tax=Vigna unguiculata TaxID=3917 RepID=A0A4D6NT25_VIGUN|nr:ribonuclease 3-like protein 2 [Vigna unguiculata]QCE15804.1 endoribonuclease Dicer [Vigna unguiculata]